ncbi:Malonyl-coenzyme A:anthocyanin 3-O-glucoside-6''-O-malonyltransferase [Morus notabilis]|uniref:Malonyl-coenzyme A:anthocyanin 3-O-glucoside-6''-O-malonyltransferase n=1 Tax=Morus notabilis TaxID=981085 RepID=W9RNG4_9ROSA|nr:coumaroyl-CoA:anthocyanidin 3-O-glucoside-6''-O-coumaroyltransferase 1 [Morus notabilis]EXB62317.1 Malonyl-coenzyme A:anthocyanin 3-O-glucoside-6''-O-malonyltransferase [Morus notabilis]
MAIPNNEVKVMEQSKKLSFPRSNTLSLTLRHFFPFAANLICPPPPAKPFILFTDDDSVSLTVAESAADFNFLSANHPRPVRALHPFVPKLAPTRVEGDGTRVGPLLALQVTVFPNSGICIGVRFNHVAADGRAFHHFMKSWTLVCKTGGDLIRLDRELGLPSHDRAAIKDPADGGVELVLLNTWWSLSSTWDIGEDPVPPDDGLTDNVRSTFVLSQAQIERLKHWVKDQLCDDKQNSTPFYISSFVVICALMLVCLVKSEEIRESNSTDVDDDDDDDDDDEPHYFIFVADCQSRLQFRLPTTYFGNCLALCYAQVKRNELLGENGIVAAVKAIGKEVAGLKNEALKEAEKWMAKWKEVVERWRHFTVAGSTKLGVYEADSGWGKPKKSESVHVDDSFAICFAESRDDIGGVKVGLALNRDGMSSFSAILEGSLTELV